MSIIDDYLARCRVPHEQKVRLEDYDPTWEGDEKIPKAQRKRQAEEILREGIEKLSEAQELLYAADTWAVLVIFQAMDAAGKDSTIKHVMSGLNPQGVQVYSFKHPSAEDLDHDFLWRCNKALPERGRIGIFNRSYFEEVLIAKVHREIVEAQRIPEADPDDKDFWKARYDDINHFELHLARNGTRILKFFLNVSKAEQKQRFLERIEDPTKHWKFSASDVEQRRYWDDYMRAYEEMLSATSTKWAPWYVVPADHKWVARAVVAAVLEKEISALDLKYPKLTPEQAKQLQVARRILESE